MRQEDKDLIIKSIGITDKTKEFVSNMYVNRGSLIQNSKPGDNQPEFVGFAKNSKGEVYRIEANIKDGTKGHQIVFKMVEVPAELLQKEESFDLPLVNEPRSLQSKIDSIRRKV